MDNPFLEDHRPDPSDEALVGLARTGDAAALERLVRRHQAWVFNIVARMVWRRSDAEDLTQEIMVKAVTRLSSFEGRSGFRTWLYRVAVNHALGALAARLRAHRRHEDRFIHPVLVERAPELLPALVGAHDAYDGAIDAIEAAFAAARAARMPEAALRLYRALNRFIAENLAHFDEEERGMEVLRARCTDAELSAIMTAFNASRAPAEALAGIETMLPALSHPERAAMLSGMREAMPAEAFAAVRAVAERSLSEAARRRLAPVLDLTAQA